MRKDISMLMLCAAMAIPAIGATTQPRTGGQRPAKETRTPQRQASKSCLKKTAPARTVSFNVSADDIIWDAPEGNQSLMAKSGSYYSSTLWGIMQDVATDIPCTIVEGEGGLYYIYNPFTGLDSGTWIKGTIEGDQLTFNFPQPVYYDYDEEDNMIVYVAQMCHFEINNEGDEEGLYYADEGDTKMVFVKDGDKWVMQTEEVNDHPVVMGLVAADDGTWCAYSDWDTSIYPFQGTTVTPPEGLTTEQWVMKMQIEGEYPAGQYLNVGFDGDDIYVQGLYTTLPDAWVKGTIADGKAVFDSKQYMGPSEMDNAFAYFFGATEEERYDEEWDYTWTETIPADNITFDYDKEKSTLTSDGSIIINKGMDEVYSLQTYTKPVIRLQGDVTDFTPANPVLTYFYPYEVDYPGTLYFLFPTLNNEGQLLDADNLYYRVYIDGELYTFYDDEYLGLDDATEEIPFYFNNGDTLGYYGTGDVTHYFGFSMDGFKTIGVQTLYRDENGEYPSDIVTYTIPSEGVSAVTADEVDCTWYDLAGLRVDNPGKGIYIVRRTMSDGTVRTDKVVVK